MPRTLLVVDDSANIREAARLALTGEEWDVEVAATPDEAFDTLRGARPDAVLCDVALGEEDGYDLVRKIRGTGGAEDLPVILMGAEVSPVASHASGANATLPKPFSSDELVQTLRAAAEAVHVDEGKDRPMEEDLGLNLGESVEELAESGEEEVEIIDLSGDEEYAELELLDDLEPIEVAAPEPLEGEDRWDALDLASGSASGERFDLNLDEFREEPLVSAETEREAPPDEPSTPRDEESDFAFALDAEEALEGLSNDELSPIEPVESPIQAVVGLDPDGWSAAIDSALEPAGAEVATPDLGEEDSRQAEPPETATPVLTADAIAAAAEKTVRDALADAFSPERLVPALEAVVERVVWEVVPPLAERLIQEAIEKLQSEPHAREE